MNTLPITAPPACGNEGTEGDGGTMEEGLANQEVWRMSCDAIWRDVSILLDFDDLNHPLAVS